MHNTCFRGNQADKTYHWKKTKQHSAYKTNTQKSAVLLCASSQHFLATWASHGAAPYTPTSQECECEQDGVTESSPLQPNPKSDSPSCFPHSILLAAGHQAQAILEGRGLDRVNSKRWGSWDQLRWLLTPWLPQPRCKLVQYIESNLVMFILCIWILSHSEKGFAHSR